MIYEMALPKFAHAMTEGEIVEWFKGEGDQVEEGEALFELMTEKVTVDVESPVTGKVKEIKVGASEMVPVGTIVALIETED